MSNVQNEDSRRRISEAPPGITAGRSQTPGDPDRSRGHISSVGQVVSAVRLEGAGTVQDFSNHHHGHTYNTTNMAHGPGPAYFINHVENAVLGSNEDLVALNNLFPAHPPVSTSTNVYLPNSRPEDEKVIWNWTCRAVGTIVLWIHGPAGIGKSTLAQHVQRQLRSEGRLAAAIFISAFRTSSPSPETIIRLIAGELGRMHPRAIPAILEAYRQCHGVGPEILVEKLILDTARSLRLLQPLIVVLDAADEWTAHTAFTEALSCIDPSVIRFIVLGRLEPQGKRTLQKLSIRLHPLGRVSNDVIEGYLNWRVDQVQWEPEPRPSAYDLKRLAEKADGLFIWAVTACSLLEDELSPSSPRNTLAAILDSRRSLGESNDLAALYRSAMILLFPRSEDQTIVGTFLGAILVLQEPLPLSAFSRMVGMREPLIAKVQARLKALQIKQPTDHHLRVHPAGSSFHLSLIEFFRSASTRADPAFSISTFNTHARFAEVGLEELTCLPSATTATISPLHQYIAKYLALHLSHGAPEVKPGSTSDWEASQLCSSLRGSPLEAFRRWCLLLLSLVEPGVEMPTRKYVDGDKGYLMMDVACRFTGGDNLQAFGIPYLCVAVRLLPDHEGAWYALGGAYWVLAEMRATRNTVQRAVVAFRNGLDAKVPPEGTGKLSIMVALASALLARHEECGGREDLGEALNLNRRVLMRCPDGHPDRSMALNNLAVSLQFQYEKTGSGDDLQEATELRREALALCPDGHPSRSMTLHNLANSLHSQYEKTGSEDELREATELRREALALSPGGHPDRAMTLNHLANSLQCHYKKRGSEDDLQEATELLREALALCPDGHPSRSMTLNNLAVSLQFQYEKTGSGGDLQEAIELRREALALCPDGHPSRSMTLNNLAVSLQFQYEKTGSGDCLQEAIELRREALALCPDGHPSRSMTLHNLAISVQYQYEKTGFGDDLQEAIQLRREALALCPDGHPSRSTTLNNLAVSLQFQYEKTGSGDDLQEATQLLREALALRPDGHPGRSMTLHNLANSIHSQFENTGSEDDLQEATELRREALALWPDGHPTRSMRLNNLANSLQSQYGKTGSEDGLREIIALRREVLALCPTGHRYHSRAIKALSEALRLTGTEEDIREAASLEETAQ